MNKNTLFSLHSSISLFLVCISLWWHDRSLPWVSFVVWLELFGSIGRTLDLRCVVFVVLSIFYEKP